MLGSVAIVYVYGVRAIGFEYQGFQLCGLHLGTDSNTEEEGLLHLYLL